MTFKDDFFFKVLLALLILGVVAFSCARKIDRAGPYCEDECRAHGAESTGFELVYWMFIQCD